MFENKIDTFMANKQVKKPFTTSKSTGESIKVN